MNTSVLMEPGGIGTTTGIPTAQTHSATSTVRRISTESTSQQGSERDQPEYPEVLPFSALRCVWNAQVASNPFMCQGYADLSVVFQSVRFQTEVPDIQVATFDRQKTVAERTVEFAKRNAAIEFLTPQISIVITVGRKVAFRSNRILLRNEMVDALDKMRHDRHDHHHHHHHHLPKAASPQPGPADQWITIDKHLHRRRSVSRLETMTKGYSPSKRQSYSAQKDVLIIKADQWEDSRWKTSLPLHHPHSVVGIHILSVDNTANSTDDEILGSRFIQAINLPLQPRLICLDFDFEFPFSNAAQVAVTRQSRKCRLAVSLQVASSFACGLGSLPAFALDPPPDLNRVFRSGPDVPVRLLATEFAHPHLVPLETGEERELFGSNDQEDIQTTLKHAQLFSDISMFWGSKIYSTVDRILSWSNPLDSLIVTVYVSVLVMVPSCTYPLLALAIACVLFLTRRVEDSLSPRIVELYSTIPEPLKVEEIKTAFPTAGGSDGEKPIGPTATETLMKSLIQSALPIELVQLTGWLQPFLAKWLPVAVCLHCVLTWTPSSLENWWKMKCYLNPLECQPDGLNQDRQSDKESDLDGWQKTPYFKSRAPSVVLLSRQMPIHSDSLLLLVICLAGFFWCFVYANRFLYLVFIFHWLWFTHALTQHTPVVIAIKRSLRAIAMWLVS